MGRVDNPPRRVLSGEQNVVHTAEILGSDGSRYTGAVM